MLFNDSKFMKTTNGKVDCSLSDSMEIEAETP